jgi:tRNA(fMet)-specific endonuclease VapC
MLLDTTFLIDIIHRHSDARAKLDELSDAGTSVAFSVLTDYELGVGFRSSTEQERYERVADSMVIEPLDRDTARRAVDIQRRLRSRGEEIGSIDALIAGTALGSSDPCVLTRNVDGFERIEGLDVESY